ncbi:MAG: SDR family oxidoreductase [Chloroflexota bacterium]
MNFKDQHAIVTGGSSGIGKATAKCLAQQGAHICIIARSNTKLEAAKAEIEAVRAEPTQNVVAISADVSDKDHLIQAIETAIDQLGPVDILVTCAGMARPGYFQSVPLDIFEQTMAINYFGTLYSVKAVLPSMIAQQRGHLILVSSGAGLIGLFGYTPYSPTKFAVRGLAESLRAELKPLNIQVSIVYPPDTDTPQLYEENKTKPPETQLITASAKMLSSDQVAVSIVQGIQQKKWSITPGMEMRLLSRWHSVMQPILNRYFDDKITKSYRKLK